MKYGVALGSGGARGAAHIALLEQLKEREIEISFVTGSSAGAIIGAFYALYPEVDLFKVFKEIIVDEKRTIESHFKTLNKKITNFPKMIAGKSFLKNEFVYRLYKNLYGNKKFSDCEIKLGIVSYDLESGKEVEITEGYIIDAVMASTSVPGVFPPLRLGGMQLLDGGVLEPVPAQLAKKLGAEYVIFSDLNSETIENFQINDGLEYLIYIDDYKNKIMVDNEAQFAEEIYSFPIKYSWEDFSYFLAIYEDAKIYLENNFKEGKKH